jgi:hypothetical protein
MHKVGVRIAIDDITGRWRFAQRADHFDQAESLCYLEVSFRLPKPLGQHLHSAGHLSF